ncbi:MAG: hypothetical protein P4L84_21670 [Isosphaeraceae bacterium]|nr:hypothetical protein [Isosphaeraceae bacterium]
MRKNRRRAFNPAVDRLDAIVLPSNVPFAFLGENLAQNALITSQGVYDTTTATFYVVPSSASSYAIATPDGIVGHDNVPFMFRALNNSDQPLYDLSGNPLFDYVVYDKTTATFIVDMPNSPGYYAVADGTPGDSNTPFVTYAGVSSNGTPLFNFAVYDNTTGYFIVHQNAAPGYFLEQLGTAGANNTPFILWSGNQEPGFQLQAGAPVLYAVYDHTTAQWSGLYWEENGSGWFLGGPFVMNQGVAGDVNTPFVTPWVNAQGYTQYGTGPAASIQFDVSVYDHTTATFHVGGFYGNAYTVQVGTLGDNNVPNINFNGFTTVPTYLLEVYDTNTAVFTDVNTQNNNYTTTAADGIIGDTNIPFLESYLLGETGNSLEYGYAHIVYDVNISTFIVVPGENTVLYPGGTYYAVQIGNPND